MLSLITPLRTPLTLLVEHLKDVRSGQFICLVISVALVLRLAAMIWTPLIPEEAYYWMYAQHLSLSYYDHPPMVAWLIAAGTWAFGSNEFGVRIAGNVLMLAASGLLYVVGRIWFNRSAGLLSAAMLHVLPVYYGIGFVATMDAAVLFFWTLGMVGVTLALRRDRTWGWYLAGLALGGAMLSKYTGVFLAVGTVLAVLVHKPWRRHLLTIHPYLAILLATALFSPVIVWNARHDWASFRFQLLDRWRGNSADFMSILKFLGFQVVVASPVFLAGFIALFVRLVRKRQVLKPRWLVTACFSLPLLFVVMHKALRNDIHINWAAPAYVCLFPGAAWMFLVHLRLGQRSSVGFEWRPGVLATVTVCSLINVGLIAFLLTVQPRLHLISAFGPWRELAAVVEHFEDQIEAESGKEPLIVADGKYRLASVLAFYRSPLEENVRAADFTTSQWLLDGKEGLGFPYWASDRDWTYDTVLYVDDDEDIHRMEKRFEHVVVVYDSAGKYPRRYQVAVCRGLRQPVSAPLAFP